MIAEGMTADTDFGTLLAIRKQTSPSVLLFRHGSQHRPADQGATSHKAAKGPRGNIELPEQHERYPR